MIHPAHWERLASSPPDEVCARSGATYDAGSNAYTLPLLNGLVQASVADRKVWCSDRRGLPGKDASYNVALLAVVYLIEARSAPLSGEWTTPQALPAGAFFFRGPHAVPTSDVAERYAHDRSGFLEAGLRLGGSQVEGGDACIELQALPRVPMRLVLWLADDEFPAQVTALFDRRVDQQLPMDVLYSLMRYVTSELVRAAGGAG